MTRYLEIKPGSIAEVAIRLRDDYQAYFKKELEKSGKGIAQMTDAEKKAFFNRVDKAYNAKNEQAKNPYAIGMAAAMKATGDKPPLKKSTIVKAHDIAKSIEKKEEVEISEEFSAELKAKAKEIAKKFAGNITKAYDEIEKIAKGLSNEPEVQKALQMANEEVEITEGQFKDIDIRKGDLKLARDKRQQLKDKYNAIMANQATGDEDSIADQIQKLDMSIKKQEQDLIDKMKKMKDNEKNEAVDPERVANLNQKIAKMTTKMGELDMSKPESKTKEAILKSDITTAKLRLQDLMQKSASDMKKAVNEMNKAKQSYKSLKMSMKKEQEMNGKKKTLTDKPLTKIEVNPKIEG